MYVICTSDKQRTNKQTNKKSRKKVKDELLETCYTSTIAFLCIGHSMKGKQLQCKL